MAKKKKMVTHLSCEECKERNYTQVVSSSRAVGSLRLKKFCDSCRDHKMHKESK